MYIPKNFEQHDVSKLKALIAEYPLATLITHSEQGLVANHIPFIFESCNGRNHLQGHIAKTNPLWKEVKDGSEILAIFHGPDCYISPNYYPTKKEHGKAVPTWNYVVAHVKGYLSFIHDLEWNLNIINKLTEQQESNQKKPWSTNDAPKDYIEKMLSAIVGVDIHIHSITGKWKASQNQANINKQGIIDALSNSDQNEHHTMANLVKEHTGKV